LDLCFCITNRETRATIGAVQRMKNVIANANFPNNITILTTTIDQEDFNRWSQYSAVVKNIHEARKLFLDGDWEYFWLVGGDNPMPPYTLKRLLDVDADVASAIINQRPNRGLGVFEDHPGSVYPVFWHQSFTAEDVRKRLDLDPRVRNAIIAAWTNLTYYDLVQAPVGKTYRNVAFGSGCSLSRRKVLEYAGYYLDSAGYHSEDIAFAQYTTRCGFDLALDTTVHCLHFDPNGAIY
jgi:hypothetical protein